MSVRSRARAAVRVATAVPWLARARWAIRRTPDPRALVLAHDRRPRRQRTRRPTVEDLRRGTDGAVRLLGPRRKECLPRSLTLFALLTRHGYPAEFVSGVRRDGDELTSHAWVEVRGAAVEAPGHDHAACCYREQIRIPSRAADAR